MKSQDLKISDEVISHLAKIIQLGILSGTDIVDHMRMIRLQESEEDTLILSDEYRESSDNQIQSMLEKVSEIQASQN